MRHFQSRTLLNMKILQKHGVRIDEEQKGIFVLPGVQSILSSL